MSHVSWMKLQGQTPHGDKLFLIRGRCCLTGTASCVFTHSPFRFPLVKYTSLPSLEAGFLKYTPMKTEAPKEREPGEWRMGTFSLRELPSLFRKTLPMWFRQRRPPQCRCRSYFRHRKVRSWCERITPRSHFSTSRAPFCSVPPPACCCWLSVQIFQSLVTVKPRWSNAFSLPFIFVFMLPSMLFSPSLPLCFLYCLISIHSETQTN